MTAYVQSLREQSAPIPSASPLEVESFLLVASRLLLMISGTAMTVSPRTRAQSSSRAKSKPESTLRVSAVKDLDGEALKTFAQTRRSGVGIRISAIIAGIRRGMIVTGHQ